MRWIVGSSLRFRWLVIFAAAVLMIFGIGETRNADVDVFPEFAPPQVEIQTIAVGNSSQQVEELITIPLEDQLNGIPGLEEMRSKSVIDLSQIQLIFSRDTDLYEARQLVQERLTAASPDLPTWASPPFMMPPLSSTSRVMKIGISSDELNMREMSVVAYWKIRQELLRVDGVANVMIYGEQLQQQHVYVDPKKLADNGVSVEQVMKSTGDALDAGLLRYSEGAVIGTGGFVESNGQRLDVRNVLPIVRPDDLARVPLEGSDGTSLRLEDVATVDWGHQPLSGDAVINDGHGLMLIVQKFPNANTVEVTRGIEEAIDDMRPGLPAMQIDTTIFRPATFIELAINNLTRALLLGVVLVILILAAFLFEWRTALISLIAIPLSLLAAVLVLQELGAIINVMILAGLVVSIGVVVDDAIIDVENIVRRLRQNRSEGTGRTLISIVLDASVEVRTAITYATLINVVAVIPVFFLPGLSGAFFKPLVLSYGLAVLVSMVVALTVTPALCLILLSRGHRHHESPLLRVLKRGYGAFLARIIRTPRPAMGVATTCLLAGVLVVPTLGTILLPDFKERDFLMHWLTKPGTSQQEEYRISVRGCQDLREIPGVRNCGSHIGQAYLSDEPYGVDFGENWISVSPRVDYDKTLAAVQETVDSYPGIYRDVQTYLRERVKEVLTGTSEAIVVRIYGPDLDVLRAKADEITEQIAPIDGVIDAHPDFAEDLPHAEIEVDLAAAEEHGLKPGDVRRQAATLVASEEVGDIFRGGKAYDVHVWSTPETRHDFTSLRELPIDTPGGEQIRLEQVADVRLGPIPNAIERTQQSRRIDVGANVEGRDLGAVVADVEEQLAGVGLPREYHLEVLGESNELAEAQKNLLIYGVAAALAIFFLLQASFGSVRLAVLLFLTLPMALVGGVLAVWMGDGILSLGSLIGFLTVFGIAARNGILMISHFQHLEREEGEAFGPALVLRGAKERLAPILMTASATGLALVPLAVAGSIAGHEIEHPMAIVILGGLITSTLLNLFVLPSLYLRFGKSRRELARMS
ncbi:MMPL family transporter [Rubrobacter tropicus]|uniref:MMPL family transporter n=1 Tax=Rubrobacter tropicus TaxID=2653851 RepID=A0A6G8QA31_9ACTN|nr:efflux RND transporter permease subunit [Rubrobacter tropicus]QIN83167.1 MMPL family transporter [Rubrobacter tropicus]